MAITLPQFARIAERTITEILGEITAGRLEAQRIGSLWLIDRDSAARWLARRYSPNT